ncbi:MAG: ABC transporter ATP-binding protein [Deltaproteobacteria bacterium]|jgi:branched-chain amino acid transport system ATP-binding protein|nr:ABC transporter ATP-binding protein [Deltaproteobacteria bacterium]MBT4089965.1 ABC transporter ATP-binding protein [Deltaproteobacteria bacterium]MBT4264100.1 ABC transporter ATP-binding protein [Deltaproteobacteria bacterium]MBT4644683.1 ABC transporter ATP-binding protein [Deltaproteobacteria bacterium]MBT6504498.1 ABC transporter ATP-binding protein [Deltaproteobacteria bacterium]
MALLSLKNIKTQYGQVKALKGVSIDVEEGTVVSLIGSNGAGKTTTLKSIFGIQKISDGEILFDGQRIDGRKPLEIAKMKIAYTMEGRHLFPQMTVLENLEMGAFIRKDKMGIKSDLDMICERFPILKDRMNQLAGNMSGGEQMVLTVGRALMSNPRLLLLDEPSLGLAPLVVKQIGQLIQEINQRGVTVFLVEQNSKLGLGAAQRGYVMEVGQIVLEGEAAELLANDHVKQMYLGG